VCGKGVCIVGGGGEGCACVFMLRVGTCVCVF
jgi:hypothetical protein